jgi:hypothetical protein
MDPIHIGEAGRALEISRQYGMILRQHAGNISQESLDGLVSAYPSHGFVIDRDEVAKLFNETRVPTPEELKLPAYFGVRGRWPMGYGEDPLIAFLSSESAEQVNQNVELANEAPPEGADAERTTVEEDRRGEPENAPAAVGAGVTQIAARSRR